MNKVYQPLYTAKIPGGMLEIVQISLNRDLDLVIRHRFEGLCRVSIVRQDAMGCNYFKAHGQRIYLSDLRKVRCLN